VIVFFDIGNCLYDPYRTFRRTLTTLGYPELADEVLERFGAYPDQPGRHDRYLTRFGFMPEQTRRYYREFIHHPILHEGVPQVLDQLRERAIRLGIISDGHFDTQVAKLQAWGIADRFDAEHTFIGSTPTDLTRAPGDYPEGVQLPGTKHDLDTFRVISERVGEPAAACAMVGDDYVRDALNPQRAGWRGIWCTPNEEARATKPEGMEEVPQIASLLELPTVVS